MDAIVEKLKPKGNKEKDSGTTPEGPPHVRADDGAEATSRRPA
jgi:hypothetical protein